MLHGTQSSKPLVYQLLNFVFQNTICIHPYPISLSDVSAVSWFHLAVPTSHALLAGGS